jgi:hypothetical protein
LSEPESDVVVCGELVLVVCGESLVVLVVELPVDVVSGELWLVEVVWGELSLVEVVCGDPSFVLPLSGEPTVGLLLDGCELAGCGELPAAGVGCCELGLVVGAGLLGCVGFVEPLVTGWLVP